MVSRVGLELKRRAPGGGGASRWGVRIMQENRDVLIDDS